ncbi:PepSY domain-containing protein [uncultured Intestinimonas sp.]|uniref:PepSY domain-containing protein n=1 Tax=uncultured Intestinimonas sp. TaxID=1689265 RepID=UPI002629E189|nr:PepSY domain-containing protein [uncultured Intestinimonas sp.]
MDRKRALAGTAALLLCLSACGGSPAGQQQASVQPAPSQAQPAGEPVQRQDQTPVETAQQGDGEIDGDTALAIALENAGVPADDAYGVKVERDEDNGIPIYDIEFETDYGDYDFEVAVSGGAIVGADHEVDEERLDDLGGSSVDMDGAREIVASKIDGASPSDVDIWEEGDDGRVRYEGEVWTDGMKYAFELDPATGRIFDWNADLRT